MNTDPSLKFSCPSCASDNVQRASLAYQQGITHIDTTSVGVGAMAGGGVGVGGGIGSTRGTGTSGLSQQLAPPKPRGTGWQALGIFIGGFVAIVGLFTFVEGGFVAVILGIGVMLFSHRQFMGSRRWNENQHSEQMNRWKQKFICLRCGTGFVPRSEG